MLKKRIYVVTFISISIISGCSDAQDRSTSVGNENVIKFSGNLKNTIPLVHTRDLELIDLYLIKKSGLYNKVSNDGIISYFEPNKIDIANGNEFERASIVSEAKKKESLALAALPLNQPFYITKQKSFNKNYNFKEHYFPFHPLPANTSYTFHLNNSNILLAMTSIKKKTIWPANNIKIDITNPNCVGSLKMSEPEARSFIDKRTSSTGSVYTGLFLKEVFIVTGYGKQGAHSYTSGHYNTLYAKLLKVVAYKSQGDYLNNKPLSVYVCR